MTRKEVIPAAAAGFTAAADVSAYSRHSMADSYRPPTQYAGGSYHEQPSCSPRGAAGSSWPDHSGKGRGEASNSSHQQGPPPGRRAVSAYSSNPSHQADFAHSTLNLVTCVLGAGALGYPFCFKECGLLLATIIMFATLIATRISYQLLLYCAQLSGRKSYEGIAEYALGKTGRQVVELCIAAMNLGALVAFLDILADVLSAVAGTVIPPGAEPSRHAYITGVTLMGALPVSLIVREPSLIANMSNAAVVFVVVFAVVVFCTAFGPSAAAALGVRWAALTHDSRAAAAAAAVKVPVLHMWHPQGVLVSLPVMAYGFTAHQYYMGIYTMLKAPTVRKMKLVTDAALLVCAGVYWTVGVGGYATFGDRTAGDIIRNFGGQRSVGFWGAYERALKLCYGMAVLGNIPLVIMPFSSILAPLLPADEQLKQQTSGLVGACTVASAKRCTAAALGGCGSGSGAQGGAQKARMSGSGGGGSGRQPLSDGGYRCAGGELAAQLDSEALVLEAPTWQRHSEHDPLHNSSSPGASDRDQKWLQQQPLLRTQAQPQRTQRTQAQPQRTQRTWRPQWEQQQPPPGDARAGSPEEAPEHPHLTRDACRAAHMLTGPQHTLVVVLVLGLGLASAVWLPNVELIFGLTGSTASVLAAFIMPALCFLRLYEMAPELGSGKRVGALSSGSSSLWRVLKHAACCCGCCGLGSLLSPSGRSRHRGFGPRPTRHSSPGASRCQYSANGSTSSSAWGQQQQHGNGGDGGSSPSKVWGPVLVVPELRAQWACRQRLAFALLAFGLISGLLCTDAILSSISEEKAVVQLAQELVAHEAVVAETSRAQQKAKEAAAAVDAVSSAAQQLGAVDTATNQTLGSLAAAAAALNTIAAPKEGTGSGKGHGAEDKQQAPSVWDLKGRIEQHKQKAAEDSVLRNVEAALSTAAADISATTASVTAVIIKLDTSIAQIKADAAAAASAAAAAPIHPPASSSSGAAGTAPGAAAGSAGLKAPDDSVVVLPADSGTGSSAIVPHAMGAASTADRTAEEQQQQEQAPVAPAAVLGGAQGGGSTSAAHAGATTTASSSSSSSADAYARANEMARELGQALGAFGKGAAGANLTLTAGRSVEQVRDSAIAALTALSVTADVLRKVRAAVAAARRAPDAQQRDSQVKSLAVQAMQRALNATAASALAMRITREALGTAATEETSELLTALTRVAQDLEKSDSAAAAGSSGKKRASITLSSDGDSKSSSGAGGGGGGGAAGAGAEGTAAPAATAAAVAGKHGAWHVATEPGSGAGADSVKAASSDGAAAGAASGSASAGAATGGSEAAGGGSSSGTPAAAPGQAGQPLAKHPTLAEHEAAAAAAANAAAHGEAESDTQVQQPQHKEEVSAGAPVRDAVLQGAPPELRPQHAHTQQPVPEAEDAAAAANAAAHADSEAAAAAKQGAPSAPGGGSSGGDSGSSGDGGSGSSSSGGSSGGDGGAAKESSVLTASEASKVKDIIGRLAAALSSGSGGGSAAAGGSSSSSTGSSAAGQQGAAVAAAANITQLAAAIREAVTWTQQSKSSVLGLIVQDLGQTDPKVGQRVMSIVQEVGTSESDADRAKEQRTAVAAAAAALDAAVVSEDSKSKQQQQQQRKEVETGGDSGSDAVAGPVLAVTADGKLQQQPTEGVAGPVVAGASTAPAAAAAAGGAASDSDTARAADSAPAGQRQQGQPEDLAGAATAAAAGTHLDDRAVWQGSADVSVDGAPAVAGKPVPPDTGTEEEREAAGAGEA